MNPDQPKKKKNPLKIKKSIMDHLQEWKDDLAEKGLKGFWPSFMQGQYVRPDNIKTMERLKRKFTQKKTARHWLLVRKGKILKIQLPEKKYKGQNLSIIQKLVNKEIDRRIRWKEYYSENNALNAIARMLLSGGTRKMRRTLAKKLLICKFGKWKSTYREAEFMLMEQDNFSGPGFDGIKRSYGVK